MEVTYLRLARLHAAFSGAQETAVIPIDTAAVRHEFPSRFTSFTNHVDPLRIPRASRASNFSHEDAPNTNH